MFDLQTIQNQIAELERSIECIKNGDCCKPICNIELIDDQLVFTLCNDTEYIIAFPAEKYITEINPVAGDDNQWELVYNDATTAIIASPYYIVNQGTGEELIFNQAGHPTYIRTLNEDGTNAKIIVSTSGDEILFKVKQYGRRDNIDFSDSLTGMGTTYVHHGTPRYENGTGNMQAVSKTGGGDIITNEETEILELHTTPIDAYKSILYFRISETFDLTYDDLSYNNAVKGKFHLILAPQLITPTAVFPATYFESVNTQYFHGNHTMASYDVYHVGSDDENNKLRRYCDSKFCDVIVQPNDGSSDPGWLGSGGVGDRLFFRYPFVDNLVDPGGGADVTLNLKFESIGSIIVHTNTDTDFLSTISGIKNH